MIVEKRIGECSELRGRLANIRRKKRDRIIIIVVYCIVAGIVMSQFLIIGATFWMLVGFFFTLALITHYRTAEAEIIDKMQNLANCEI